NFWNVEGEYVKSGGKTVKCVTGLNIAQLMVGSEGTLGVFDEITLKLVPPPVASKAMLAEFDDINKASETVAAIISNKIVPCTLEFLDNASIKYVDDFTKAGLPRDAAAILLIEVDGGHMALVEDDAAKVVEICRKQGATRVQLAKDAAEKTKLWEARRNALPALARARPTTVLEDATVPRSQIPAMIKAINEIGEKYRLQIGTFGHAGDGNLHPTILTDRRDKEEFHRVEQAVDEIFDVALRLGGTLSGEHGIGIAKSKWLEKETSRASIIYSRRLKKAVDSNYLLNPGKIIGG
ncbi:MAG: FAD-linked oxidase C-terminal domain-containing protein, partial [Pseudomonadota bacterium]|nr:FAD-linked oxidase C-terminal domain-containing protein [Pseudomonadota bacterium]